MEEESDPIPSCGTVSHRKRMAPHGEVIRPPPRGEPEMVYVHVDVLVARNLPAMDVDGLATPVYIVECGNTKVEQMEVLASLNPTFMDRMCLKAMRLFLTQGV